MNGINKIVRDSIFLRFAANEDHTPIKTTRFNSSLWGIVAVLGFVLGMGTSSDIKLNAKEIAIPSIPQGYPRQEYIFNTDFTKPLPKLNFKINDNISTCSHALEIPPTLINTLNSCADSKDEEHVIQFGDNRYTFFQSYI